MRKITILALMAGAIISAGGASAQGVYLDFGNNPGPRYRDYDDGPRYRDYEGTVSRGALRRSGRPRILSARRISRLLTDVKTDGPFKTASATIPGLLNPGRRQAGRGFLRVSYFALPALGLREAPLALAPCGVSVDGSARPNSFRGGASYGDKQGR